jgi:predicted MFS family arabinose efflux permease
VPGDDFPSLCVVAACVGASFSSVTVGLPLEVLAQHGGASSAGLLLGLTTGGTALGAAVASPLRTRLSGADALLVVALVLVCSGGVAVATATARPGQAAGAALLGTGIGCFWVANQTLLGAASGRQGSERAFLLHYSAFTAGTVVGSVGTGAAASLLQAAGVARVPSLQLGMGVGVLGALLALWTWRPSAHGATPAAAASGRPNLLRGVRVQAPDLLLISGLAVSGNLSAIVLTDGFGFSAGAVGAVLAAVGVAKVAGTVLARSLAASRGVPTAVTLLLSAASVLFVVLALARSPWLFVPAVLAAVLVLAGAWPLLVDACQARTAVADRASFAAAWNVREYATIAGVTVAASAAYGAAHATAPIFALAAVLLAGAVLAGRATMRRPVHVPLAAAPAAAHRPELPA